MKSTHRLNSLALLALAGLLGSATAAPIISEFMALNTFTLADEDGAYSDWIEIYNPDITAVALSGWHLTDASGNLTKWTFPAVTLDPGQFLVVFASSKNRIVVGSNLHTNFTLAEAGGYLALVAPDGTTKSTEFNPFPAQRKDVSFGSPFAQSNLVLGDATGNYLVPADGSLGSTWTATGFTPAGWSSGSQGFGFGLLTPGITVNEITSTGQVPNLAAVDSLIAGNNVLSSDTRIRQVVNLNGDGSPGHYTPDDTFIGGIQIGGNLHEHHIVHATGYVVIPAAGVYTFGVMADDGSRIRVDINGDGDFNDAGENVKVDDTGHGMTDEMGTATFAAPGNYAYDVVYFENEGGDGLELYAIAGAKAGWDNTIKLLGDTANGGLATLTTPDNLGGGALGPYVNTNVQSVLQSFNSTLYTRIPFTFPPGTPLNTLTLGMRYNDGFVAYLNGVEVARRNAPVSPDWQSASTATRSVIDSLTQESINLSALRSSIVNNNNVLAIQGLNASPADSSFLVQAELSAAGLIVPNVLSFFDQPTAAKPNTTPASSGFVLDLAVSVPRGIYSSPFSLNITCATPGSTIIYTTDGSSPTLSNGTAIPPVNPGATGLALLGINQTTVVRAIGVKTGSISTRVETDTYLFLSDVITQGAPAGWPAAGVGPNSQLLDYGMDSSIVNNGDSSIGGTASTTSSLQAIPTVCLSLPTSSLTNGATGIYVNADLTGSSWEREAAMEIINDPSSVTHHNLARCGVRIRGGYGLEDANPKHAFRLYFRNQYGDGKLSYPVFPGDATAVTNFTEIDLTCAQNYSWSSSGSVTNTFLRDQFVSDAQADMGSPSQRNRYVHLYLNGSYWGVYAIQERPEAAFASSYRGGAETDYDVIKTEGAPYTTTAVNGDLTAWNDLRTKARIAYYTSKGLNADGTTVHVPAYTVTEKNTAYFKLLGLAANGSTVTADPVLMEERNLMDYLLLTFFSGNGDGPLSNLQSNNSPNNHFALRDRRGGAGFFFVTHDSEHTFEATLAQADRTGPFGLFNNSPWSAPALYNAQLLHQDLSPSPEYQIRFADRVYKHLLDANGVLSVASNQARVNQLAATLEPAMIAESARWGDAKGTARTAADWRTAKTTLYDYFAARNATVLDQLRTDGLYPATLDAPILTPLSGPLALNTPVLMSNPGVSAIYFTVDGADPRSVSTVASPLGPITGTAVARTAIVDSIASGNSWKYFVSATAPAANWKDSSFSDASWSAGNSRLGFGAGGGTNATSITAVDTDPVTAGTQKNLTYYFRRTISIPNPALLTGATLEIQRDDGCVVYLNGTEISRQNMPAGTITHTTPASSDTSAADAQVWFPIPISPASLATGNNLFAAEVHILANNSVRMGFNLRLRTQQPSVNVPAGLAAGTHVVRARSIDVNGNWSAMSEQTYVVGSSTPYQTWKTTNGISNGSLDADLDGISNVLEYATGSNPNVRTTKPPVITTNKQNFTLTPPAVSGTYLTLQFVRSLTATDVTWTVETSSTLTGTWSPTPATLVTDVNNGDGTATSTYRLNTPFPGYGIRAFFRARATVP